MTDRSADTIEKFAASCNAVRPEHIRPRYPDDSPVRWPESVRLDQITLPCGVHLLRFKWQGRLFVHSRWICDACNVESEQEIPWGGPSMPGIRAVLADVGRKMLDLQASKTARLEALGAEARALVEFAAASECEP